MNLQEKLHCFIFKKSNMILTFDLFFVLWCLNVKYIFFERNVFRFQQS